EQELPIPAAERGNGPPRAAGPVAGPPYRPTLGDGGRQPLHQSGRAGPGGCHGPEGDPLGGKPGIDSRGGAEGLRHEDEDLGPPGRRDPAAGSAFSVRTARAGASRRGRPRDRGFEVVPGGEAVPMIEVRGVTKRFGSKCAVDRLDLEVRAGELFAFLGPNGAGKTTTIKMICGLLSPSAGTVPSGS